MKVRLEFKLADCWIGLFWKLIPVGVTSNKRGSLARPITVSEMHVWVCLLPCLPIHLWWVLKTVENL